MADLFWVAIVVAIIGAAVFVAFKQRRKHVDHGVVDMTPDPKPFNIRDKR